MNTPILTTKLHFPLPSPNLVARPRLIDRMNEGLECKLTLISAPAGFGKTTLVSEWVEHLRLTAGSDGRPASRCAWLSLDEEDNDPARFLAYFIAGLNSVGGMNITLGEGLLGMLHSPQPQPLPTGAVLTTLINEIGSISEKLIFVLDDYHLLGSSPIDHVLTFILEHLPAQMHLIIATRDDPHLPLARLRARGQLAELRAADLRFSPSEAAEFLNQVMGLALSEEDILTLESRTEGWIAGLQLAAISIQGRQDTANLIRSFAGSHRFVLDYLVEEVLEQQPPAIQDFLLYTAVVDRFNGSLCDALTGQHNGQATLEMLERANLFIVPLDGERRWYRYHHLFADLLRLRLRQTQPEQVLELNARASEWYEQQRFEDEAIDHALRAEDFERAVRLVEAQLDAAWGNGEHGKLRRWLARLPQECLFSKPQLCILRAWYLFAGGQREEGERSLQAAEQNLTPGADPFAELSSNSQTSLQSDQEREMLLGRVAAVRASMASYLGDVPGIIQHARRALRYLPEPDAAMRSLAALALGNAYGFKGEMDAAYQARLEAAEASKSKGNAYFSILAYLEVAITLREQGRLQRTTEICQQQLQFAKQIGLSQSPVAGCLLAIWGEVLAEQGDLDNACRLARRGVERTRNGELAMFGWSHLRLMRILFSLGDWAAAQEIVDQVEQTNRNSDVPPWITNRMAAWQARLWLAQGKLEAAIRWMDQRWIENGTGSKPLHPMDYFTLIEYLVVARILIACQRPNEATSLLQPMLETAETGGRGTRTIEILNLLALAHQASADGAQALAALARALALAEPEGFLRIFADEGPPMAALLHEALSKGIAPAYVGRLLQAFSTVKAGEVEGVEPQASPLALIEPLSQREMEVLQLLAAGLTNAQVASRLCLSLNTVKVHTRNIYGKLGVHSRTQAVAEARALGMLLFS